MNDTAQTGMPRLNEAAPAFEAPTTDGVKKLEDYSGNGVLPNDQWTFH